MTRDPSSRCGDWVYEEFVRRFGTAPPCIVRAPGRVNLIGEHTDYNDGFVLPMAIDRATWIALRPRRDDRVTMFSLNHRAAVEFSLGELKKTPRHWGEYAKGVAWALQLAGYDLHGWEGVTNCDVPMGAGLSSSASFELAVARAFCAVSDWQWQPVPMAKLCQRAENEWVGVNCGIMDQMISSCGKAGHALLIDCRSLEFRHVPLPAGSAVVVLDTTTRRGLVDSAYNVRRIQCEAAAKFFGVKALRDVTREQFEARPAGLGERTRRLARHVITENDRTLQAAATTDPARFGKLMNASHESLRDDFEVTNEELNLIVDCARNVRGCFGARMTGAGFGGCAVALVWDGALDKFVKKVRAEYHEKARVTTSIYICQATNGVEIFS